VRCLGFHPHTQTHRYIQRHTRTHKRTHTHTDTYTREHAQDHRIYTDTNKVLSVEVSACFLAYAWVVPPFSEGVHVDVLFIAGPKPWYL
jgi:hypothetical protein